jgi:hypothetical protein
MYGVKAPLTLRRGLLRWKTAEIHLYMLSNKLLMCHVEHG